MTAFPYISYEGLDKAVIPKTPSQPVTLAKPLTKGVSGNTWTQADGGAHCVPELESCLELEPSPRKKARAAVKRQRAEED